MTSAQLEIFATVFGLIQGILVMLNKRCNWIVYIIQLAFLIGFSYVNRLYGDLVQSGIMVAICIYAFIQWGKPESSITFLSGNRRVATATIVAIGTLAGYIILRGTNDPLPLLDSFTTVTTFVALALLSLRKIEAWVVWLVNDLAYMVEYAMLPDQAMYLLALYIIWTFMAVLSLVTWYMEYMSKGKAL